jgi:hypothetical protein
MVLERAARKEWLVQRMGAPTAGFPSAFSFGGGYVNGGFNADVMNLLKGIISFDYMGSAEFEWGAVPMAFKDLAVLRKNNDLGTFTMTFDPAKCSKLYDTFRKGLINEKPKEVYIIAGGNEIEKIKDFLTRLAEKETYPDGRSTDTNISLLEWSYFAAVLRYPDEFKTVAWIELGYPAFWTVSATVYEQMKQLYRLHEHQKGDSHKT